MKIKQTDLRRFTAMVRAMKKLQELFWPLHGGAKGELSARTLEEAMRIVVWAGFGARPVPKLTKAQRALLEDIMMGEVRHAIEVAGGWRGRALHILKQRGLVEQTPDGSLVAHITIVDASRPDEPILEGPDAEA